MSDPADLTPGTSNGLTAEAIVAQLRSMRSQIEGLAPLSKERRRQVKQFLRDQPASVVDAAINVIGVLDNVSQAIGQPLDEVRQLQDDQLRWDAAVDEARAFLQGLEGATLNRRHRLALLAGQAYAIGSQLARDPARAVLVPHIEEIKRLKKVSRRRKATPAADTPESLPDRSIAATS